jgi:hypothetical protein
LCDEDGLTSETDAAIAFQPAQQAEQADASLRASWPSWAPPCSWRTAWS